MPSTAAATESSSELSVERAGAANEVLLLHREQFSVGGAGKDLDGQLRFKGNPYTLADLCEQRRERRARRRDGET